MEPNTDIAGLYSSAPEQLPFAPSLEIRTFLLERERGNLLIYTSNTLEVDASAIAELGGVTRQYLNHWHEAMLASTWAAAPLFVHEGDRASVAETSHVRATFSKRHTLDEDFEVIPTPGHTPGATAFLWDSGEHRLLFTGDTLLLSDGEWVAAVLDSSDRGTYVESLELIRELDFDVLVPWAASGGQPYYSFTTQPETRDRIDVILERVRRGEGS